MWFAGSCGAVMFSCFLVFGMIYTKRVNFGTVGMLALGIVAAWQVSGCSAPNEIRAQRPVTAEGD